MDKLRGISTKIGGLRRALGMTQEELGKELSVSAQAVSKWENGDSLPDLSLIVKLAETFSCTTDYLLGREGGIASLLPQITESFVSMTQEEKIEFLGNIISATDASMFPPFEESRNGHPALVHIHLGPSGLGLWARDRLVCIATTTFLEEAIDTLEEEGIQFPLTMIPDHVGLVLLALLRNMEDLKPYYAVDEQTLKSKLPTITDFDSVLTDCIELGFVDRVRGGYRLNFRSELAVRLLAVIHQTIIKQGTMNVAVGQPR